MTTAPAHRPLDVLVPRWDFRERHSLRVPPGVDAAAALEDVTFGELPLFRSLLFLASFGRLRARKSDPFLPHLLGGGFRVLSSRPGPLVVGSVVRVARPRGPLPLGDDPASAASAFAAAVEPGLYKVAFDVTGDAGRVCTETRVVATSPDARARFARYWTLIRVPSGLIRLEWLAAARRRAVEERPSR